MDFLKDTSTPQTRRSQKRRLADTNQETGANKRPRHAGDAFGSQMGACLNQPPFPTLGPSQPTPSLNLQHTNQTMAAHHFNHGPAPGTHSYHHLHHSHLHSAGGNVPPGQIGAVPGQMSFMGQTTTGQHTNHPMMTSHPHFPMPSAGTSGATGKPMDSLFFKQMPSMAGMAGKTTGSTGGGNMFNDQALPPPPQQVIPPMMHHNHHHQSGVQLHQQVLQQQQQQQNGLSFHHMSTSATRGQPFHHPHHHGTQHFGHHSSGVPGTNATGMNGMFPPHLMTPHPGNTTVMNGGPPSMDGSQMSTKQRPSTPSGTSVDGKSTTSVPPKVTPATPSGSHSLRGTSQQGVVPGVHSAMPDGMPQIGRHDSNALCPTCPALHAKIQELIDTNEKAAEMQNALKQQIQTLEAEASKKQDKRSVKTERSGSKKGKNSLKDDKKNEESEKKIKTLQTNVALYRSTLSKVMQQIGLPIETRSFGEDDCESFCSLVDQLMTKRNMMMNPGNGLVNLPPAAQQTSMHFQQHRGSGDPSSFVKSAMHQQQFSLPQLQSSSHHSPQTHVRHAHPPHAHGHQQQHNVSAQFHGSTNGAMSTHVTHTTVHGGSAAMNVFSVNQVQMPIPGMISQNVPLTHGTHPTRSEMEAASMLST